MNFCVAILILKMEEHTKQFQYIMLCYFKKGKNTTEYNRLVQYMEKVLWLIECVKSCCEVSWYYCYFGQIILCCEAVLWLKRCLNHPCPVMTTKPIAGDSWHTQNIQIYKVIGDTKKNTSYFMEKINEICWEPPCLVSEAVTPMVKAESELGP